MTSGDTIKIVRLTPVLFTIPGIFRGQLRYLAENGFEVHLITSPGPHAAQVERDEQCIHHPVRITRQVSPVADALAIVRVYRILKRIQPAIVHTHTSKGGLIGITAGRLAGVPCCIHSIPGFSAYEMPEPGRSIVLACERITFSLAHRLVPNSVSMKEFLCAKGLLPQGKADIIGHGSSNGVDLLRFSRTEQACAAARQYREKLGIRDSDTVFVFVGRISREKGIEELIQAFIGIPGNDTRLLLLGDLESNRALLSDRTVSIIKEHPRIHLTGWTDDVPGFLACAHILVLPTYHEGFPNALLQGAAMGLPCIATDVRGCRDIIEHMQTGLLVPPRDPGALREAMETLLKSKELQKTLSHNNHENVEAKWGSLQVSRNLKSYYDGLLFQPAGSS